MSSFRPVNDLLSGAFATFFCLPKQPRVVWPALSRYRRQVSDSHQVVCSGGELEDPTDQLQASVSSLTQQSYRLQPTKDLFDSFALPLTDFVTRMTRGALVNGAAAGPFVVLRHV